jgi:uncharacterized membrane protein YphA (DoxX/SURF4 family)
MGFRDGKQKGIQLNKAIKNVFENNLIELTARWILGLTFIYASYHKILAPGDFAKIVYGYGLFPHAVINLIAIILPFIEFVAGLALILGIYPRSAVLIINAMLIAFGTLSICYWDYKFSYLAVSEKDVLVLFQRVMPHKFRCMFFCS